MSSIQDAVRALWQAAQGMSAKRRTGGPKNGKASRDGRRTRREEERRVEETVEETVETEEPGGQVVWEDNASNVVVQVPIAVQDTSAQDIQALKDLEHMLEEELEYVYSSMEELDASVVGLMQTGGRSSESTAGVGSSHGHGRVHAGSTTRHVQGQGHTSMRASDLHAGVSSVSGWNGGSGSVGLRTWKMDAAATSSVWTEGGNDELGTMYNEVVADTFGSLQKLHMLRQKHLDARRVVTNRLESTATTHKVIADNLTALFKAAQHQLYEQFTQTMLSLQELEKDSYEQLQHTDNLLSEQTAKIEDTMEKVNMRCRLENKQSFVQSYHAMEEQVNRTLGMDVPDLELPDQESLLTNVQSFSSFLTAVVKGELPQAQSQAETTTTTTTNTNNSSGDEPQHTQ